MLSRIQDVRVVLITRVWGRSANIETSKLPGLTKEERGQLHPDQANSMTREHPTIRLQRLLLDLKGVLTPPGRS